MGERLRGAPQGRTQVIDTRNGVATATFRGVLTIARINDVMAELSAHASHEGRPLAIVLDVLHIDGFEPGVPARIIHWLGTHASVIPVAVLVTPSPVLHATVRAAALLLPGTVYVSTSTRAEAISTAERMIGSRQRVSTDLRHVVPAAFTRKESA